MFDEPPLTDEEYYRIWFPKAPEDDDEDMDFPPEWEDDEE